MPGKSGSRSTKFQAHTQRRVQSGNSQAEIRHASTAPRQNTDKLDAPGGVRLNKAIAAAGLCSRRKADELILAGQVLVNGVLEANPARHVLPDDCIAVNGRELTAAQEYCYLLLHKPVQTVCTVSDPEGRPTVMEYLPAGVRHLRLYPVGRLDYHSEGLLIMTNDGDLDYILTHPSHEVTKTYEVTVRGRYSPKLADKMSRGVRIDTGITAPCEIEVLGYDKEKNKTKVKMVLHEGKNREIRKMMAAYHYPVFGLVRTGYAFLTPEGLSRGMSRRLTSEEVRKLYELYR